MKARTTILAVAAAALILAASPIAAKDKFPKPKANEVVIVTRILVAPQINDEFFSHYAENMKDRLGDLRIITRAPEKGEKPGHSVAFFINKVGKSDFYQSNYDVGKLGDLIFLKRPIPKDRQIEIDGARVSIFGNPLLSFDLPIFERIEIPEGSNYIYLGTFVFNTKDEYFNIEKISQIDEYDSSAKAVTDNYGPDAKLVRVNLLELPAKK